MDMKWRTNAAKVAIALDRITTETILILIFIVLTLVVSTVIDSVRLTARGIHGVKYCDFDELLRINPDTCAWLRIYGTHINHPVVRGEDNYRYLDTDFYGKYYAGGTLFLCSENSRDLSDEFNVIHGHHMARGAMFGDLGQYYDREFFDEHRTGVILTLERNYRLALAAVCRVNSHDNRIYDVSLKRKTHIEAIRETAVHTCRRDFDWGKLLVLSTCTGDIDDHRTVVVFTMEYDPKLKTPEEEDGDGRS